MRHIDTGHSGNHPTATLCCYPNLLESPAIVTSFGLPGGELSYFGPGDIGAAADMNAVAQAGVTVRRFPLEGRDFLGALVTESTVFVGVTYPMATANLRMALHAAVIRTLHKMGLGREVLRSVNNDVQIYHRGQWRKVFGDFTVRGKRFNTCAGFATFGFDLEAGRAIYDLSAGKFAQKGGVEDIGDIVGGLWDAQPDAEMIDFCDLIVKMLARRLDVDAVPGDFTATEQSKLDSIYAKMRGKGWLERGEWPTEAR